MVTRKLLFLFLIPIFLLVFVVVVLEIQTLKNRPSAIMGYWEPTSSQLQNTGDHFSRNGMLEVDFRFKEPGGVEHVSYSLFKEGISRPILNSVQLFTSSGQEKGSWGGVDFPISHYPNKLNLGPGKYVVQVYINGKEMDSATFYVDKPITIHGG